MIIFNLIFHLDLGFFLKILDMAYFQYYLIEQIITFALYLIFASVITEYKQSTIFYISLIFLI